MSHLASPYQLLEINIISAQDLSPVSKSIKAYAVAWLHPERKLSTQIDHVGHTNPTWNEKFVYRVDDEFLNSDNSVIMIEIYTSAWLRDVLIGTVGVLLNNLVPPGSRTGNRKPKLRFVALQIRRPSGRPQGILNIGVTLLDSTMRSMPLYSELSTSQVGYWDVMDSNKKKLNHTDTSSSSSDPKLLTLQRCQSERNDSSLCDYNYYNGGGKNSYNGYVVDGQDSDISGPFQRKWGNNDESLCSDVGPSPSVVAAAIAKGLYPLPAAPGTMESSGIDGWTETNHTEGMNTKIERWRNEMTPAYDKQVEVYDVNNNIEVKKKLVQTPKRPGKTPKRTNRRGNGLFSCFGTAFGCEFSISCGGGGRKKKRGTGKANQGASELTYEDSSTFS